MAEENPDVMLKMETEDESSLFISDDNTQLASNLLLWKTPQNTLLQQVEVEEQSVKIVLSQLQELKSRLLKYTKTIPSVINRIDSIDSALSRKRNCRITAGAVAPTGIGKSSLWNAVLGFRELLPTDNSHACTSTIIEVLWNPSDDPAALFQAKIIFLQVGEWRIEIEQLYKDVEALARKDAGDDDGDDWELKARVEAVMEKVRAVYPLIDNTLDLKKTSVTKLMDHENVKNLGEELGFFGPDLKKFSSQIRPFVISSVRGAKFAPWPLVKVAQVFVKSEILKDGLVIVDIPGNMDTNAARNSTAQDYQNNLAVNCVLAKSNRAASDQLAQINLSETYQRNLQLDGHWKADNMVFVVVQTDECITVEDHLEKNPEVAEKLGYVIEQEKAWTQRKTLLQGEINTAHADIIKKRTAVNVFTRNLRKPEASLKRFAVAKGITTRGAEISELLKAVLALDGLSDKAKAKAFELASFRKDRAGIKNQMETCFHLKSIKQLELKKIELLLDRAKCSKTRACIEHRSLIQTGKIYEYFDRISKETGNQADGKPLPVVCVSATKYLDFLDNKPPSPGFPLPHNTKIPQLQKILAATTLEARHRNAKAALEEIEALVVSIKSWAKTLDTTYQLSPEGRKEIEEKFEEDANNMLQNFSRLHLKATDDVIKAVRTGILLKLRPVEIDAASKTPATADSWASVHWATYRATVNGMGEFQRTVRDQPFSWSNDLAGKYLTKDPKEIDPKDIKHSIFQHSWTNVFDTKLPSIHRQTNEAANNLVLDFSRTVVASAEVLCPAIREPLQCLKESIDHLQLVIEESYNLTWEESLYGARSSSHRLIKPQIQKFLTPIFERAALERGNGFKKRIKGILRDHVKANALSMYEESTTTVMTALARKVTGLRGHLDAAPDDLIVQARDLFKMVLDNHKPTDASTIRALSAIKGKLLNDVALVINNLMASLEHNVHIPLEEEDEEVFSYEVDERVDQIEEEIPPELKEGYNGSVNLSDDDDDDDDDFMVGDE